MLLYDVRRRIGILFGSLFLIFIITFLFTPFFSVCIFGYVGFNLYERNSCMKWISFENIAMVFGFICGALLFLSSYGYPAYIRNGVYPYVLGLIGICIFWGSVLLKEFALFLRKNKKAPC